MIDVRRIAAFLLAVAAAACGSSPMSSSPTSPTVPSPSPTPTPAPVPTPGPPTFSISMPLRMGDRAANAFGLNPFGAHIGDHGIDGHPGWDVEYALGSTVLAAADGTIQSVLPADGGATFTIQVTHAVGGRDAYRTIYSVRTAVGGITAGAAVTSGQALGVVPSYTRTIGTTTVTYAFIHFQLDDFSSSAGQTNRNAVSPEGFLNAEGRQIFDAMWADAAYTQELVEPFATNPRDVSFPMRRTWTLQSGSLATRIEFTRADAFANGFGYVMRDASGSAIESGTVELEVLARPSAIDLLPSGSAQRRRGVYSIRDDSMQLTYGAPGASRPTSLSGASTYVTSR